MVSAAYRRYPTISIAIYFSVRRQPALRHCSLSLVLFFKYLRLRTNHLITFWWGKGLKVQGIFDRLVNRLPIHLYFLPTLNHFPLQSYIAP